jgi:cell division protein FtsB
VSRQRLAAAIAVVGGLLFGFAGGEYGTLDWWQLRREVRAELAAMEQLRLDNDSLRAVAVGLEGDPVVQERVARERYGMLRPGELLFRVEVAMPLEGERRPD